MFTISFSPPAHQKILRFKYYSHNYCFIFQRQRDSDTRNQLMPCFTIVYIISNENHLQFLTSSEKSVVSLKIVSALPIHNKSHSKSLTSRLKFDPFPNATRKFSPLDKKKLFRFYLSLKNYQEC